MALSSLPKFSTLSKRQQMAIAIGVPVAIALILGVVIYQKLGLLGPDPGLPEMVQRTVDPQSWYARINELQAQIDQYDLTIKKRPLCERELKDLESEIELANDMLPREKEIRDIIQKLNEIGRQIPPEIGTLAVGDVFQANSSEGTSGRGSSSNPNELPQVVFDVYVKGSTNGILKYIDLIERSPHRYMAVTNINLKPGRYVPDKDAIHEAKLTMVTYQYQPKKAKGR